MRRFITRTGIGVLLLVPACALFFAAMAADPPEDITIDDCQTKQAAVAFPHAAHMEREACVTCHHTQEDLTADNGTAEPCSKCHLEPEDAATPKCSQMSLTKNHFHINCVNCHKDAVKENAEVKAPVKCAECHPKS